MLFPMIVKLRIHKGGERTASLGFCPWLGPGALGRELLASWNKHRTLHPSPRKARLPYLVFGNVCLLFVDSFSNRATEENSGEATKYRISSV